MTIRWIDAGRVSAIRSQSIYHGLGYALTPETPDTVVMVIPETPYMCIGFFQEAAKEIDLIFCRDNKLPVIRRETGGGAVYIDSGQMFVQWICQPGSLPRKVEQRFQLFNKVIIETYKFFGIQAYHHPVNDVHVNGRKIVGTGAASIGNAEVVTGNFLFDFSIDTMTQALNIPNPEFRNVVRNSLDNYMTWIKRELKVPPSYQEVTRIYKEQCEQVLGKPLLEGEFTSAELEAIAEAEEKLVSEDWLHSVRVSPSKNKLVKIHAAVWVGWIAYKFDDWTLQVFSQMRNNTLEMIRFYLPAYLTPQWNLNQLEVKLVSAPLEGDEINKRITDFFQQEGFETVMPIDHWTNAVMQIKNEVRKASGYA
ncbi:MAG: biotin/lipoate A/B protein ligase family protein [Bacteroidota bacterium]